MRKHTKQCTYLDARALVFPISDLRLGDFEVELSEYYRNTLSLFRIPKNKVYNAKRVPRVYHKR